MKAFRQRVLIAAVSVFTAGFFAASPAFAVAVACTGTCAPVVTATVSSTLTFNVSIVELLPAAGGGTTIGPAVTAMNFGALASQGKWDDDNNPATPDVSRSMSSLKAFQVFFGINAQQRPFSIKQSSSGIGLASGTNTIPAGGFIVTPLQGVGGDTTKPLPAGISVAPRTSAIGSNIELFSRASNGTSNTMAATYGITDDPAFGATQPIPLDQPAGTYTTTITFTATVT